jgi:hypothetical protein
MTLLELEEFLLLSEVAAGEEDQDRLVAVLTKRNACIGRLISEEADAFADEIGECLDRETLILERLEAERHKIVKEMEKVSHARKAARSYSTSYPLPSLPRFFHNKG